MQRQKRRWKSFSTRSSQREEAQFKMNRGVTSSKRLRRTIHLGLQEMTWVLADARLWQKHSRSTSEHTNASEPVQHLSSCETAATGPADTVALRAAARPA